MPLNTMFTQHRSVRFLTSATLAALVSACIPLGFTYRFGIGRPDQGYVTLLDFITFSLVSLFYFTFALLVYKHRNDWFTCLIRGVAAGVIGGFCALMLSESLTARGLSGFTPLRSSFFMGAIVIAFGTGAAMFGLLLSLCDFILLRAFTGESRDIK